MSTSLIFTDRRAKLQAGLYLLLQGWEYAQELDRDRWDFAVEVSSLQRAGLSNSDIRWLIWKEYAAFAQETPQDRWGRRVFTEPGGAFRITDDTCLALTDPGLAFAREILAGPTDHAGACGAATGFHQPPLGDSPPNSGDADSLLPKWDRDRQELWLGPALVKRFKLPSRNQETILMAFEEDAWAPRIDDPLTPHPTIDPKRRLSDTIKGLNRNQKQRLIRFMGDGSGLGVRWEKLAHVEPHAAPRHAPDMAVADGCHV